MKTRKPRTIKSGHCLECNRPLKDPVSMAIGMGPVCRKNAGVSTSSASIGGLFNARDAGLPERRIVDDLPPADVDVVYDYQGLGGCECHCQVRIWWRDVADAAFRKALVVVTELPSNQGTSITNWAEYLWPLIQSDFEIPVDLDMYEHYPACGSLDPEAHFNAVSFTGSPSSTFSPQMGRTLARAGNPHWSGMYTTAQMAVRIEAFHAGGKAVVA